MHPPCPHHKSTLHTLQKGPHPTQEPVSYCPLSPNMAGVNSPKMSVHSSVPRLEQVGSQLQACFRDSTRADPATRLTSSGIESTATVQEEGREAGTDVGTAVVDQDSHYSTMPAEASVSAPHRARSVGIRHEPYLRSMGRRQPTETKST